MKSSYNSHVKRVILGLVIFAAVGFVGKEISSPKSFGVYGHYRADAVQEEADRDIRHKTNTPCLPCHTYEAGLHLNGLHKTISCEFCHGPMADHVTDGIKTGELPVRKGEEIRVLCLRCHNKAIHARPEDVIKTVVMPDHLRDQKVRETHTCNQCHHVHAPYNYIDHAKKASGIKEAS